jgi:phosphatidylglycerophosphate synthase
MKTTFIGLNDAVLVWLPLVGIVGFVLLSLGVYALRTAIHGRDHSQRVKQVGGSVLLGEYFMNYGIWLMQPIVNAAKRLQVHPDQISWASLLFHFAAAFSIGLGNFGVGGLLLCFGAGFDSIDGAVARAMGLACDAGEVLDAVIDRWAEMAVFFGFAWYYRDFPLGFLLAVTACAGAVMVSYTRAKGESMNIQAKMGLMQRHERGAYIAVATILASPIEMIWPSPDRPLYLIVLVVLGLIAFFGSLTSIQRTVFIRRELKKR